MDASYYKEKYEPINGKWLIKETLGVGSYGQVFRIEHEDILGQKTEAALKVITIPKSEQELANVRESLQDDHSISLYITNMATKIADEFNVMAQLKGNTHIVSYEEHDIIPHENGIGYDILIRMELLKPLNKLTDNMTEGEVIKLGIDICKALEVCKQYNIVHRDIKPENIFISPIGNYKLGDFGVAKTMNSELSFMTVTGTYTYMAPELKKGEECSANVDIYSLGMVMYRLLNFNREPFLPLPPEMFTFSQREQALIDRMKGLPLPKPANAGDRLAEIVLKACEYNPKTRYDNPTQMRVDLEKLLAGEPSGFEKVIDAPTGNIEYSTQPQEVSVTEEPSVHEPAFDGTVSIFDELSVDPLNASISKSVVPPLNVVTPPSASVDLDKSVSLFSDVVINPPVENRVDKNDSAVSERTPAPMPNEAVGTPPVKHNVQKNPRNSGYKVIIGKATTTPLTYDIAVDGVLYQKDVKEKFTEVSLSAGEHNITIRLHALTNFISTINPKKITPETQEKLRKWIKLYSVSLKVSERSKIIFASDPNASGNEPSLKIISVETESGLEAFANLDTITQKESAAKNTNTTLVHNSVAEKKAVQSSETYSIELKRFYIRGLTDPSRDRFAVDITVDGALVATEKSGDYTLVLSKGVHQVEIGYSKNHTELEKTNPSIFKRKIYFTATSQGELRFGIDKMSGSLKPAIPKGGVSNVVVKW